MKQERVTHTFSPVYDKNSKILILGTFPSVKSRENNFYYGHPQNRFWKVLAALTGRDVPSAIEEKKELLLQENIAVWDVISSCDISGSSDSSIKNVVVNDFSEIFKRADIRQIFANGTKAYELYKRYVTKKDNIIKLPSTSPANAAYNLERLCSEWSIIMESRDKI